MFNTHCHLTDKEYNKDRDQAIERAREAGITKILTVCSEVSELNLFGQLLDKYDFIYGAVGVHPHNARNFEKDWPLLEKAFQKKNVIALGEIGLDYHYNYSPQPYQIAAFRRQLQLAKEKSLPVIIHSREAMEDSLKIIQEERVTAGAGVMHCFSGSIKDMNKCLDLGLYISIAGPVTFATATDLKEIAKNVPTNRLLVETDDPFLAPEPVRGQRNEPAYLKYVLEEIAKMRNISLQELIKATTKNALLLFKL
ncbi:MAG: TatD family hydrolase [bacterium]